MSRPNLQHGPVTVNEELINPPDVHKVAPLPFVEYHGDYYLVVKRGDNTLYATKPPPEYLANGSQIGQNALALAERMVNMALARSPLTPAIAVFFQPLAAQRLLIQCNYSYLTPSDLRDLENNHPVLQGVGGMDGGYRMKA